MLFNFQSSFFRKTRLFHIITVWSLFTLSVYFFKRSHYINDLHELVLFWVVGVISIIYSSRIRPRTHLKDEEFENQLHISNLLYHAVIETSPDSVSVTDLTGRFIFCSKQTAILHGYETPEELIGTSALKLFPIKEVANATKHMDQTLASGSIKNIKFNLRRKDGSTFPAELSASLIKDNNGLPLAFIAIVRDLTDRNFAQEEIENRNKQLQNQLTEIEKLQEILREQAIQDPLTGLYNRRYMEASLKHEASRAAREGYPISIVMLDMDNLKELNDNYGHAAGDEAIKLISSTILELTRAEDVACRYGGDEFLVILHNTSVAVAEKRVEEWLKRVRESSFVYHSFTLQTSFSAGIASASKDWRKVEKDITRADNALYQAKMRGKKNIVASTTEIQV